MDSPSREIIGRVRELANQGQWTQASSVALIWISKMGHADVNTARRLADILTK